MKECQIQRLLHSKFEGIKKGNLRLKLKGYLCFTAYIKIISRLIIDLNVKGKIIKFLGDDKGEYLHDLKREGFLKQIVKNTDH